MPDVRTVPLPADSRLHALRRPGDFLDCYGVASAMSPRAAAGIITDFPDWARGLLQVRRLVTSPFGLSQDGPEAPDKVGPFPVEYDDEAELVAGFDDKHLNFRVSVMSQGGQVSLATWVDPHNLGGRLYLAAIMPFHIAIARNALARVARAPAVA
ncbi:hypothetical protein JANAI62_33300 [Jannaschia pagri]|uniref:DUF2867 domain-containing protein n=1 Tax=Jannaschia pagri TaxID=2829797 RepID=A0ABQ4NQP8_9RHOB|nr:MULTISPECIES: DUF2867 domain-containing protein [unclassified Jannaschia]GIT92872.1 hypothetical protein JANAI61_33300 [Jannaschia sp. AI_61]GIT96707.1 hypothetical protein JANAI62_33300 [Jannaschia sp. AI_62]